MIQSSSDGVKLESVWSNVESGVLEKRRKTNFQWEDSSFKYTIFDIDFNVLIIHMLLTDTFFNHETWG